MDDILVFCPQTRDLAVSLDSIKALAKGHDLVFMRDGDDPNDHRFANCTAKCERGRQMALAGGYAALLLVDDDQIYPSDTIEKLARHDAPIAYGLTVWRHPPHHWSAAMVLKGESQLRMVSAIPSVLPEIWGSTIEVVGVGSFGTLIQREVLEKVVFERRGQHCLDWYLSQDAQRLGLRQVCDTSVVIGHIAERGVLWPDPDTIWRVG